MTTKLLQRAVLISAILLATSAELGTDRVQKFNFQTATHYRKEYKDRDGTVYGEYGVHMPDGWTRVLLYEAVADKMDRLVQEYRTPTNQLLGGGRRSSLLTKFRKSSPSQEEELKNETEPEIQIIAVPHLWKVRGQDLVPSASEQRPVALAVTRSDLPPTLAPPRLTDQRALYNFGYDAPFHGHNETGTDRGAKFGEYYVDLPDCWRSVVRYWADESGYHPTLRRMRTPGCDQQKREAFRPSPTVEAGKPAAGGPSSREQLPSDTPDLRAGRVPTEGRQQGTEAQAPAVQRQDAEVSTPTQSDRRTDPAPEGPQQQTAEVPAPAESEQRRRVDPRGPSPSPAEPASCGSRGAGGKSAAPSRPYGFAYNAGTHYHWERGFANGTKVGAYAVQLPDGTLRTTTYTADCNGFKPSVTVEPLDESKFLRDFQAFNPPEEAKLFEVGEQPQASALVRSEPEQAPPNLVRRPPVSQGLERSAEVAGEPPGLEQRQEQRKTTTTTPVPTTSEPPTTKTTTAETTTAAPPPTAAPPRTSASPRRPVGGSRSPARRLAPIVPLRPVGSGPYHFYVHLRHNYHEERSYENGTVAGQYGVVGPDGVLREVGYTSERGFVPTLTDTPVSADHDLRTRPQKL